MLQVPVDGWLHDSVHLFLITDHLWDRVGAQLLDWQPGGASSLVDLTVRSFEGFDIAI